MLFDSVAPDRLEQMGKISVDDSEAHVLSPQLESDEGEPPRIIVRDNPSHESVGRDLAQRDRVAFRGERKVDHRCDCIPKQVAKADHARQAKETSTDAGVTPGRRMNTPVSDQVKKVIDERGNDEAFELQELTDKIHCNQCRRYMTSGHVHCYCGRILLVYTNQDPVIGDQIQRHVKQQFELLTTSAFLWVKGRTKEQM